MCHVDGELKRTIGPRDCFGEMALIDEGPRSATIVAATDLRCLALSAWEFKPFVEEHPPIAWALLATLAERLRCAPGRPLISDARPVRALDLPLANRSSANGARSNGVGRPSASQRDVLPDHRSLLESVAREARRVDQPLRLDASTDDRVVVRAHLVVPPPAASNG